MDFLSYWRLSEREFSAYFARHITRGATISAGIRRRFSCFGVAMITDGIDALTELVIGCAIRVHDALGPGLLESIYRDCLVIELIANGLTVEVERCVQIVCIRSTRRRSSRI